jgi:hypothetical protein
MRKIISATGCTGLLALLLLPSLPSAQAQGHRPGPDDGPRFGAPPQGGPNFEGDDFDGPPGPPEGRRFADERLGRDRPQGGRQGGRPGGPGGMSGMRGGMRGKRELTRLWRGIDRLEHSSTPLSKGQAKKVVAVVVPWSKRPQMTEDDSKKVEAQLTAILTSDQKNALEQGRGGRDGFGGPRGPRPEGRDRGGDGPDGGPDGRPGGRRGGGQGGFGGGRDQGGPGGGRGQGGMDPQKMQQMRSFMEKFNPFYAPTGYSQWKSLPERIQERMADRYKDDRAILEALSKKSRS